MSERAIRCGEPAPPDAPGNVCARRGGPLDESYSPSESSAPKATFVADAVHSGSSSSSMSSDMIPLDSKLLLPLLLVLAVVAFAALLSATSRICDCDSDEAPDSLPAATSFGLRCGFGCGERDGDEPEPEPEPEPPDEVELEVTVRPASACVSIVVARAGLPKARPEVEWSPLLESSELCWSSESVVDAALECEWPDARGTRVVIIVSRTRAASESTSSTRLCPFGRGSVREARSGDMADDRLTKGSNTRCGIVPVRCAVLNTQSKREGKSIRRIEELRRTRQPPRRTRAALSNSASGKCLLLVNLFI